MKMRFLTRRGEPRAGASTAGPVTRPRTLVAAPFSPDAGPPLALGMLTASLRAHRHGRLADRFDIRRPESYESAWSAIRQHRGPVIVLCSNYVWSLEQNLSFVDRVRSERPEVMVVHGGPSTPKYSVDAEQFLRARAPGPEILVRGEGEVTLPLLVEAIDAASGHLLPEVLDDLAGVAYVDPSSGRFVEGPERPRISDLPDLPSPYLTGEFDHLGDSDFHVAVIETNRGCPYGCTFCDWGSSTLSRVRKFDLDRVEAELAWIAMKPIYGVCIADANFGMLERDIDIAARIVEIHQRTGAPAMVAFTPAKNTTRHLIEIMDLLQAEGIAVNAALSLQTVDETTLEAVGRQNISTDRYVELAAAFRQRRHPLMSDLLIGMPGQTRASFARDLQFMFDHEIMARAWTLVNLPNAPMNAEEYRQRWGIVVAENGTVRETTTFNEADRDFMTALRDIEVIVERFGVMRHVLRYLQWDHGWPATEAMAALISIDPARLPALANVLQDLAAAPTTESGWDEVYADVRSFALERGPGVTASTGLETAVAVNRFLMPQIGRTVPDTIELEHDYVAYYRDATRSLHEIGRPGTPERPLAEYPPGNLTIVADPLGLSTHGLVLPGSPRELTARGTDLAGVDADCEYDSPLRRVLPAARSSLVAWQH